MIALDWLVYLTLALLLGVAGQLARVAIGIKKLNEKKAAGDSSTGFDPQKLWISLALGALAGLLTAIVKWDASSSLQPESIFTLMAAGYAGSDIVEGLIERVAKP